MAIFIGDSHGNINYIKDVIWKHKIYGQSFIHVGDFGVGYPNNKETWLKDLDTFLTKYNCSMYVVRGNHDDPEYFKGKHVYSNLKLVEDYTVLQIEGKSILCVGGGISINRKQCTYGIDVFHNEEFVFNEDKVKDLRGIDCVVTHVAPDFCYPNGPMPRIVMEFAAFDSNLLSDLLVEREDVTKLYNALKVNNNITDWFYGHYHKSHNEIIDGTIFTLLDINEFKDY